MTSLAVIFVLLGALCHATWNLLLKRAVNQEVFAWCLTIGGSVTLAPLAAVLFWIHLPDPTGYRFALASAALQVFYFIALGRAYSRGDLSLVYPIARGIGPVLVPVLAVLVLGETAAWPAVAGIIFIILGIYVVSWWGRFREIIGQPLVVLRDAGVGYAILTGLIITSYTLVDKRGVEHIQPFLYMYLLTLGAAVGLAPYVLVIHGLAPVKREWQQNFWPIMASGVLVFLAYGLVLTAFSLSRVSYVAPAREVGIVIGVLMGVFVLKERLGGGRLLGSAFIVGGLLLVALSP